MNETLKTLIFVGVAAAAVVLAWVAAPEPVEPDFFDDEGEPFFEEFTTPEQVANLEVVAFDADTASASRFMVNNKDGRWTIPSHHDYPADAKDRMAKAAGLLIGLEKGSVRSDRAADHSDLGVVDPEESSGDLEGRGTRVTFRDAGGGELASLIIGKEVEDRDGQRFVRLPGQNRTYVAKVPAEVNTRFGDWIETDLLKLDSWNVDHLVFDNHSIEERGFRAVLVPGEKLLVTKKDSKWSLDGLKENEETKEDRISEVTRELDDVKIVGVRPKPPGLTGALETAQGFKLEAIMANLGQRGYYVGPENKIVSNEGEIVAGTTEGISYRLRFGEVIWGTGESVTAGATNGDGKPKDPKSEEKGEEKEGQGLKANRYLMVTAAFDDALLTKPETEALAQDHLDERRTARTAIDEIVRAVNKYKEKNEDKLPETLVALTEGEEAPLKKLDKDPWDRDYVLKANEDGTFRVLSLAEDGAEGGEKVAADIDSSALSKESDLQEVARKWKDYEKKVKDGQEKAKTLSDRFGPWYYVIDADSYKKLKVARADVVKEKEKKEEEEAKKEEEKKEGASNGDGK